MPRRQAPAQKAAVDFSAAAFCIGDRDEGVSVLRRPGSDLLSQVLRLSTIGAGEFNGRVRDGNGFGLPAKTTRPAKDRKKKQAFRASDAQTPDSAEDLASQALVYSHAHARMGIDK